ncbi:MAG: hypothetical protein KDD99_16985, partial [Bacteroidetes bacterium]|nr:hypothetical protein [Bacteroidota bacterium]
MSIQAEAQIQPRKVQTQPVKPTPKSDTTKVKRVQIINSDLLTYLQKNGIGLQKLLGDVQLKQDSTLFYCDSAYYFESQNKIEAYSKVKVLMPDNLSMSSDKLSYDTDTKISEVYNNITLTNQDVVLTTDRMTYFRNENYGLYKEGGKMVDDDNVLTSITGYYYPKEDMAYFREKVKLESPEYVLETDTLGYDIETKVSYFLTKTLITSDDGIIETSNGFYDTENGVVTLYARSTVKDSSYTLVADTLTYLEKQDLGYAIGNVLIEQEDSSLQIRGGYGEFNRKTDQSLVTRNAVAIQLFDDDTLYMMADTLFSIKTKTTTPLPQPRATRKKTEKKDQSPKAKEDGIIKPGTISTNQDSIPQDSLNTDSLLNIPQDSTLKADLDSVVIDTTIKTELESDSILTDLTSDSLNSSDLVVNDTFSQDTLANIPFADQDSADPYLIGPPLPEVVDTLEYRLFKAYNNVRLYMNGMQGRADSMVYFYDDSLMYLYGNPVLWSEENQISGDTIILWMKDEKIDSMWIGQNAFMASKEDTVGFNQIKGKEMRAKFKDNDLFRLHVVGNSESIYFAKNEEDSTNIYYAGMNKALSQEMIIYFVENEVKRIVFLSKPEGTFYPYFEVIFQDNKLDGMQWRVSERPVRPEIFEKPVKENLEEMDLLEDTEESTQSTESKESDTIESSEELPEKESSDSEQINQNLEKENPEKRKNLLLPKN